MLEAENLVKQFEKNEKKHKKVLFSAVDHVSLHIKEGEIVGVLGPNGAGKTTLIKIIIGEEPADSGQVIISKDRTIGYLSQHQDMNFNDTVYNVMLDSEPSLLSDEDLWSGISSATAFLSIVSLLNLFSYLDVIGEEYSDT